MHKNTFFLVLILAIIASLLVGVNIGRKYSPIQQSVSEVPTTTPTPPPTPFTNPLCGISFTLPAGIEVASESSDSAQFINPDSSAILLVCQKEIPRIALPASKIETVHIASVAAKLYHTTSTKDGTPFDAIIFRNPTTAMDIYLAGLGSTFSAIIKSIIILP